MTITPVYTAILILVFIGLSVRTLRLRRRLGIPLGDRGNEEMSRAMRVHANFAEYVPIALFGIFMFELSGGGAALTHLLGAALVIGRISHAYGVSRSPEDYRYRVFGMALTFTVLAVAAFALLTAYIWIG